MAVEFMRAAITSGEEGSFRAVASAAGSTANGERGPTRFSANAFRESLSRSSRYPLLWQHQDASPVGVANLSLGDEGLVLDGQLALEVQKAREARELMKMGALDGVSIGFTAVKVHMETHGGKSVRMVDQARLMEVSIVTFPADPNARVLDVHKETTVEDLAPLVSPEAQAAFAEILREQLAGRQFSEGNLTKLRAALGTLVDLVEKVDPGHIAALGRRAAQSLKKSIVLMPKKGAAAKTKCAAILRSERMRLMDMHAAGIAGVPLLKTEYEPYPDPKIPAETALMRTLQAFSELPAEGRKVLFVEAVKQYLVASGDAEEAEEDAAPAGREATAEDGDGNPTSVVHE